VLERLWDAQQKTIALLEAAEHAGDIRAALLAVREVRESLTFEAKLLAEALLGDDRQGSERTVHVVQWVGPDGHRIGEETLPLVADGSETDYIAALRKSRVLAEAGIVVGETVIRPTPVPDLNRRGRNGGSGPR
jgi:hypothetical protein